MADLLSDLGALDFAATRNAFACSLDVTGFLVQLTLSVLNVGLNVSRHEEHLLDVEAQAHSLANLWTAFDSMAGRMSPFESGIAPRVAAAEAVLGALRSQWDGFDERIAKSVGDMKNELNRVVARQRAAEEKQQQNEAGLLSIRERVDRIGSESESVQSR